MSQSHKTKGRPFDNQIQKEFKEKIRGDKYQTLCSECELEISLIEHTEKDEQPVKCEVLETYQENLQVQSLYTGLQNQKKIWLNQRFCYFKDQWRFQDIQKGSSLPEYLFQAEHDLSYILYRLQSQVFQKEPSQETVKKNFNEKRILMGQQSLNQKTYQSPSQKHERFFDAKELAFLFFLCIKQKKLLTQSIFSYYQENMKAFLHLMNRGLEKIKEKLFKNQIISEQQMNIEQYLNLELDSDERKTKKMTKPISKRSKKKSAYKKGKTLISEDKNKSSSQNNGTYDLCIKSINYICWAYWYVIDKSVQSQ